MQSHALPQSGGSISSSSNWENEGSRAGDTSWSPTAGALLEHLRRRTAGRKKCTHADAQLSALDAQLHASSVEQDGMDEQEDADDGANPQVGLSKCVQMMEWQLPIEICSRHYTHPWMHTRSRAHIYTHAGCTHKLCTQGDGDLPEQGQPSTAVEDDVANGQVGWCASVQLSTTADICVCIKGPATLFTRCTCTRACAHTKTHEHGHTYMHSQTVHTGWRRSAWAVAAGHSHGGWCCKWPGRLVAAEIGVPWPVVFGKAADLPRCTLVNTHAQLHTHTYIPHTHTHTHTCTHTHTYKHIRVCLYLSVAWPPMRMLCFFSMMGSTIWVDGVMGSTITPSTRRRAASSNSAVASLCLAPLWPALPR